MTKILAIFIGLALNNNAFAILGPFYHDHIRCKITYTQLDLKTNEEKSVTITYQDSYRDHDFVADCVVGSTGLEKKIINWMSKSYTNIVTDVTLTSCKLRTESWFQNTWSDYRVCDDKYNDEMDYWLRKGNPLQVGSDLYKKTK